MLARLSLCRQGRCGASKRELADCDLARDAHLEAPYTELAVMSTPVPSLQDLAVESVVTQAWEQNPAHVFRLLAKVRQNTAALLDHDVVEIQDTVGHIYRAYAHKLPLTLRVVLNEILQMSPMYGVRVRLYELDVGVDDQVWRKYVKAIAAHARVLFDTPPEMSVVYEEMELPHLDMKVSDLVFCLMEYKEALKMWGDFYPRTLLGVPRDEGPEVFFRTFDADQIVFDKELPADNYWLQRPLQLWNWNSRANSPPERNFMRAGDPTDPAAVTFLRNCRYVRAIAKLVHFAHFELEKLVEEKAVVHRLFQGVCSDDKDLEAPPRVVVSQRVPRS